MESMEARTMRSIAVVGRRVRLDVAGDGVVLPYTRATPVVLRKLAKLKICGKAMILPTVYGLTIVSFMSMY